MSDSDLNFFSTNEPNTSLDNSSTQDTSSKDASQNTTSSETNFYTEERTQPTNDFDTFYENTTKSNLYEQSTTYSYQSYGSTVPDPVKKEHPVLKKVTKLIACAACFGVVAGSCFFGTTKLYEHLTVLLLELSST